VGTTTNKEQQRMGNSNKGTTIGKGITIGEERQAGSSQRCEVTSRE